MNNSDFLCQFSRHVPKILRRQLILQLAELYFGSNGNNKNTILECCRPSVQRFYGALLFVDISGFTVLSQKLNVEELKNHINEYFSKILDIIDKHDGDVVKFAGDALYIVWESCVSASDNKHESSDKNKIALEKAVECGKEIILTCSDHRIVLNHNKALRRIAGTDSPNASFASLPPTHSHSTSSNKVDSSSSSSVEEEIAYLNIHSGVSFGLMAGIDIGADNRWEYFLIGEPLSRVAEAESLARSGDLILCPDSHALLHEEHHTSFVGSAIHSIGSAMKQFRSKLHRESSGLHFQSVELPCGCCTTATGYCIIKMVPTAGKEQRKGRRTRKSTGEETNSIMTSISNDLDDVLKAFEGDFKKQFDKHKLSLRLTKPDGLLKDHGDLSEDVMRAAFHDWAEMCLTDDVARHVHHVMRSGYVFANPSRLGAFDRDFEDSVHAMDDFLSSPLNQPRLNARSTFVDSPVSVSGGSPQVPKTMSLPPPFGASVSSMNSSGGGGATRSSPLTLISGSCSPAFNSRAASPAGNSRPASPSIQLESLNHVPVLARRSRSRKSDGESSDSNSVESFANTASKSSFVRKKESLLFNALASSYGANNSASSLAEQRNVTVMFIKVLKMDANLLNDSSRGRVGSTYRFLGTTLNEKAADQRLLTRFQRCYEILSGALTTHGGQIRQFIVDDKGTVCIGTFGLRGSVSDDNVASALNAAGEIISQMQSLELQCSIGVTVGRAYCGLVGSSTRHEYVVMGPSTNLSARLMCKAPACGVICDAETRQRDRIHEFIRLQDIEAKGYAAPVGTFQPIFPDLQKGFHGHFSTESSRPSSAGFDEDSLFQNHEIILQMVNATLGCSRLEGRDKDVTKVLQFAFAELVSPAPAIKEKQKIFNLSYPTRVIGVLGTSGIGKSVFASNLREKVFNVCSRIAGGNIHMLKSRCDVYNDDSLFGMWKPIVIELILRIYRSRRGPMNTVSISVSSELAKAIEFLLSMLPEDMLHISPLLSIFAYGCDRPSEQKTFLSKDNLSLASHLLVGVIKVYSSIMQNLVFISM